MQMENTASVANEAHAVRMTRARAAAVRASNGRDLPNLSVGETWRAQGGNLKRVAGDENANVVNAPVTLQPKRRAVLKDVSNMCRDSYSDCIPVPNPKNSAKIKPDSGKHIVKSAMLAEGGGKDKLVEEAHVSGCKVLRQSKQADIHSFDKSIENDPVIKNGCKTIFSEKQISRVDAGVSSPQANDEVDISENCMVTSGCIYVDIDSDHTDPKKCSLYATEIHDTLRSIELIQRPSSNFMRTVQRDITPSMRGILVDWLVEVALEFQLANDTLYLSVYILDLFLSHRHIDRPRLQLLGITSLLIASKYEEIIVRPVEDFCYVTDNTYRREDVLKMEREVLHCLKFRLSVATTKIFLRRFLRAAQASCKALDLLLKFLANYLAELTLIDYAFLKFTPSMIAASAVFLALWTLDQSCCPWNATLEHFTLYKASDLKATVLALRSLQLDMNKCPLCAIYNKYSQPKYESVAKLTAQELPLSFF